jgi:hypothetical protein
MRIILAVLEKTLLMALDPRYLKVVVLLILLSISFSCGESNDLETQIEPNEQSIKSETIEPLDQYISMIEEARDSEYLDFLRLPEATYDLQYNVSIVAELLYEEQELIEVPEYQSFPKVLSYYYIHRTSEKGDIFLSDGNIPGLPGELVLSMNSLMLEKSLPVNWNFNFQSILIEGEYYPFFYQRPKIQYIKDDIEGTLLDFSSFADYPNSGTLIGPITSNLAIFVSSFPISLRGNKLVDDRVIALYNWQTQSYESIVILPGTEKLSLLGSTDFNPQRNIDSSKRLYMKWTPDKDSNNEFIVETNGRVFIYDTRNNFLYSFSHPISIDPSRNLKTFEISYVLEETESILYQQITEIGYFLYRFTIDWDNPVATNYDLIQTWIE